MFDETLVVQSAVSAFNNAALVAPSFFWLGVLWAPLMALAYFYGGDFMCRIGWQESQLQRNAAVMTVVVTMLWLVLGGWNYGVLRDAGSLLPYCIAVVVFAGSMLIGAASRGIKLPRWRGTSWRRRLMIIAALAVVLFIVGMSGAPTWWGAALQIAAVAGGVILGRRWRRADAPNAICGFVIFAVSTIMLMQPEFFRFGQLGRLSVVHMGALLALALAVAAAVALRNVRPRGRIHRSAYVKLKWMLRFVAALGIVLFLLTESVPVFLGTAAVMFIMFAMSVWHATVVPENLWGRCGALALGLFGLITVLPVISALGVMVWAADGRGGRLADAKFLL